MKALTIKQPWAWAIAHAGKNIENRKWRTHYRGELAIHASLRSDRHAKLPRGVRQPEETELVLGGIIAVADLVDVVQAARSKWFAGSYGWVLENIRPLADPVLCTGRLGLWSPSPRAIREIQSQL